MHVAGRMAANTEREAVVYRLMGPNKAVCCLRPGAVGVLHLEVCLTSILQASLSDVSETNPATVVLQEPVVWCADDKAFKCKRMLRVGESWIRNLRARVDPPCEPAP